MSESNYDWNLDVEAKKAIIKNRILQLAKDGYQLQLNYNLAVKVADAETIEKYKSGLDGFKSSFEYHKEELRKLEE